MSIPRSLVLITIDCLRADHCGFMGYERPTTPSLDGLAAESFVFPAAIAAGVPTYYSVPAMLASRSPLAFGRESLGLGVAEPNLASVLQSAGYATAFFGAANPYLSPRFGYDFGFDVFRDFLDDDSTSTSDSAGPPNGAGWARRLNQTLDKMSHRLGPVGAAYDELYFQYCQRRAATPAKSLDELRRSPAADVIVDQAAAWLNSVNDRPCFLWLHFMDPHSPYYPTEKGQERFGEKTTPEQARYLNACWNRSDLSTHRLQRYKEGIVSLYDSAIRWVDEQISRFIEIMRRQNRWENCILAVTADHGEEFLDHRGRYHAPLSLAEELIHVPLLLRVPDTEKRELSTAPFSLLHLAPTLLDAAKLPACQAFQGRSFWREIQVGGARSEPAIAECIAGCANPFHPGSRRSHRLLAARETRYKLVLNFETSTEQLFNLEADPAEQASLPDETAKPERARLLQTALQYLNRPHQRNSAEYLRTRLREIGFSLPCVSGQPVASPAIRAC